MSRVARESDIKIARRNSPLGKIPPGYYLAPSAQFRDVQHPEKAIQGLFTDHLIPQDSVVGEYRGRRLSCAESDRKSRGTRVYYFEVTDDDDNCLFVIDGAPKAQSSFLRYVNAPYKPEDGNCKFAQVGEHILLYAARDIPQHTELTAWYGPHTLDIIHGRV